ncbi:MAG: 7-cyano-7-deazaguanine synthase [Caulobacteraceae bacterium]|nr:7-cyano-7-deazaguanine synthase [Caulobacteraceae bacterium]
MSTALVLFSAGQDSATCLAWALDALRARRDDRLRLRPAPRRRNEPTSDPARRDRAAASRMGRARLGGDVVVDLSGYGALAESALTADRAIEMLESGLPSTFVPARNLVFLSVAAAHAYRRSAATLVGGMCETDYSGYPDCRRETIDAMEQALSLGLASPLKIETPLMRLTKAETWALAHQLGGAALVETILEHSHTCYEGDRSHRHDWGYGCGECPACDLRAKGWREWAATKGCLNPRCARAGEANGERGHRIPP